MELQDLYYLLSYFLLYAFLGWVLEVVYHAVSMGIVVNRGFLNGPVCPIYGCGMIVVLVLLEPFSDNMPLLFLTGTLFATLIELIGGFVMFKLFHMRWWDYSREPFNIGGYVCAKFSLAWGFCILFAVRIVHPFVSLHVDLWNRPLGYVLTVLLYLLFFLDLVQTVLAIAHLNKNLERLNALSADIRSMSDDLTEKIGNRAVETNVKLQEGRVQAALGKAELSDELEELRDRLIRHRYFGTGRLLRAFPQLKHASYNEELYSAVLRLKDKAAEHKAKTQHK